MNSEANKERVRNWIVGHTNIADESAFEKSFDETMAQDYVMVHGPIKRDKAGHLDFAKSFQKPFGANDWKVEVYDIIAQGKAVAANFSIMGEHTGEFAGIPASGKTVTFKIVIYCFCNDEGLVNKMDFYYDLESVVAQIKDE